MEQAIVVLVVMGFLMIAAEVFVPGLVLGILGGMCLLASVVLCYVAFGPLVGTAAFVGLGVLTFSGFLIWLKVFPYTPIGRRLMLQKVQKAEDPTRGAELVGSEGMAITPLRPAGTAKIGGRRVDVVAENGFIDADTAVVVVAQDGMSVVVRPAPTASTPEKPD